MCLAQGPQRSDAGEARTRGPSVSSQALYHWATALPSQRVLKLLSAQASSYKVHSREITYKSSKGEQQFLNARHPLDLLYIYTIYYQNISKDIKVIERTSFPL